MKTVVHAVLVAVFFAAAIPTAFAEDRSEYLPWAGDAAERRGSMITADPLNPPIGPTGQILEPTAFSCDHATKQCTCRLSLANDCKLMKSLVCKGETTCQGMTCTCNALK